MAAGRPLTFNRDKILNRILIQFWKQGYKRVSMDDLCKLSGLSKPSLYNSFGSKEELFLECFDSYNQQYVKSIVNALYQESDYVTGISKMLKAAAEKLQNPKLPSGCLAVTGLAEVVGISKKIDTHVKKVQEVFFESLVSYFTSRGLNSAKAFNMAQYSVGQLYALAVFSKTNPKLFEFHKYLATILPTLKILAND